MKSARIRTNPVKDSNKYVTLRLRGQLCSYVPHTTRDLWGLLILGSDVNDHIKLAVYWWCGIYPKSVYMSRHLLVRKAHNRRQKEMNATLVYRIFNQLRSKKCEYVSQFSFIFCTVFFNPWKFLSCELKWLAGIGVIRYCGHSQTIVPCSPVPVPHVFFWHEPEGCRLQTSEAAFGHDPLLS